MAISVILDPQFNGYKQTILSWRFCNIPPYTTRRFPNAEPNKNYLFLCQIKGCGSSEFNTISGGVVECANCDTQYVLEWGH